MTIEQLAPAERDFIAWLGEALARAPEAALDLVLQAPEDPALITTRIEGGRFESLSLRAIGPRLRWERPLGPLELPLDGLAPKALDVHGLDLTDLDVGASLVRLDCSANALQQLDLSRATRLETLDVSANDLMVLELREHTAIRTIDASGNALSAVWIHPDAPLRELRCSRNQLMVLELGPRPDLRELRLDRNALVLLTLETPELRVLAVQHNQLTALNLSALANLRSLDVSRNRLASLDLAGTPVLRDLYCSHNYLDRLDASALGHLEELHADENQLQAVALPPGPALVQLELAGNRLARLAITSDALEHLDVSTNELTALELDTPALTSLCAANNQLARFELRATPDLVHLDLTGNPLERLDLTHATQLTHVDVDGSPTVLASQALIRQLPALRRASGLPVHEDPDAMDRYELHHLASTYRAPDRDQMLLRVVTDTERCARGTALQVYWASHPHYYLQFSERDEVPPYAQAGWDLLEAIEERVRTGAYVHDDVPFDPRSDRSLDPAGTDWTQVPTTAREQRRSIPAWMARASS